MASAEKARFGESAEPVTGDCRELALTLKPAELEALVERLCSCGTLRASCIAPRRTRTRCAARRLRMGWCRLGERAAGRLIDTRFG